MATWTPEGVEKVESSIVMKRGAAPHASNDAPAFITRKGLQLPKQVSFDKWVGIGSYLSGVVSSSAWCLGDWLVYGETRFTGRYRDAIELTFLDYQTLRNYAWVARRFPISCRRDTLSFTHHAEVAALNEPERDFWLRKAEDYGWSVKRLRREVKASLLERSAELEGSDGWGPGAGVSHLSQDAAGQRKETVYLTVPIAADHLGSYQAVASRHGLNIETWAGQILARAAGRAPDKSL
jgi:hypothetical protein